MDEKTVKCFLSNEELEEYDIDYKDFLTRSEKAKEVVQEIIEQAEEMVGYKPPKFAFDLQIMMMPDQGLVLTFSEKEPLDEKDGGQILDCLKEMKKVLEKKSEELKAKPTAEIPQSKPIEAIFRFDNIRKLMEYATILPKNLRVHSELYMLEGNYYLYMTKNAASYTRYSRACIQAMEFSNTFIAQEDKLIYLREHGECLINQHAIKKLRLDQQK